MYCTKTNVHRIRVWYFNVKTIKKIYKKVWLYEEINVSTFQNRIFAHRIVLYCFVRFTKDNLPKKFQV